MSSMTKFCHLRPAPPPQIRVSSVAQENALVSTTSTLTRQCFDLRAQRNESLIFSAAKGV